LSFAQQNLAFVPTWLESAGETLFVSAPLAAAPALGVDLAVLGRAEELLEGVVLHRTPEESAAAEKDAKLRQRTKNAAEKNAIECRHCVN
jgi:hypothetical protein